MILSDGMKKVCEEVLEKLKENNSKLKSCKHHDFSSEATPIRKYCKHYRCTHCSGEVDASDKAWYELGLKHGEKSE